jgi:predicted  nucleic acid-binding Zn-ribbon protein
MPERYSVMPLWAWILGALLVIGLILVTTRVVRVQYELGEVQAKFERADKEAERAAARGAEFDKRVNELEAANEDAQTKLDQANSENVELKSKLSSELEAAKTQRADVQAKLDQANSEIAPLKSKLGSAQSELQEKQARIEALQNELTDTKRAADEAKADAAKAKEQSNAIQGKLDQANAETVGVTYYYKQNVYDASDNAIGEVSDVLLDKDGHVTAMILVGGFLGLGTKYVSVPFNALRVTEKDGKRYLVVDTTTDALMNAPGYQYDKTKGQWVPETR